MWRRRFLGAAAALPWLAARSSADDGQADPMRLESPEPDGLAFLAYRPDGPSRHYRGTRFEASGLLVGGAKGGPDWFRPWRHPHLPEEHDHVTGPAEEYDIEGPASFAAAKPGGAFLKVGVGVLEKPADGRPYAFSRRYRVLAAPAWKVESEPGRLAMTQELRHPELGGWRLVKVLSVAGRRLAIRHELTNLGTAPLATEWYCHHFCRAGDGPIGPGYSVTVPSGLKEVDAAGLRDAATFADGVLRFRRPLKGDTIHLKAAADPAPGGWSLTLAHAPTKSEVAVRCDAPLARFAVWAAETTLCPEPFVRFRLEPGAAATWTTTYDFRRAGDVAAGQ